MLASLALIILVGLSAAAICQRLRLPRIIGMLLTGILLGPYVLDLLDPSILGISAELRQIALIILLKAGLSLNLADLKRVGRPAVLMSCLPAGFEILGYVLLAPALLGVTRLEAAVMGAVLSAVSPAVVVPRMLKLMDEGCGTAKSIPQMILAGVSCDDIFVIVLFTTFLGMAQGGAVRAADLLDIPVSILLGVALGGAVRAGAVAPVRARLRRRPSHPQQHEGHDSAGCGLSADGGGGLGGAQGGRVRTAGGGEHGVRAEAAEHGGGDQAVIGSVPLAMGLPCGSMVLSVAVLGILITAPLGAFAWT